MTPVEFFLAWIIVGLMISAFKIKKFFDVRDGIIKNRRDQLISEKLQQVQSLMGESTGFKSVIVVTVALNVLLGPLVIILMAHEYYKYGRKAPQ